MQNITIALGMIFGSAMLSAVVWNYVQRQTFGSGGIVMIPFGVLLIGLALWRTAAISVSPEGGIKVELEQVKAEVGLVKEEIGIVEKASIPKEVMDVLIKPINDKIESLENKVAEYHKVKPSKINVPAQPMLSTFKLFRSDVNRAPSGYTYIGCNEPSTWAVKFCQSDINIVTLSTQAGGKCGHGVYELNCVSK